MGWPLSQDYNEAVQNPRTSFGDPDLKAGSAVPGPLGLPLPCSGNFADVYPIRGADGRTWAVKCFTRPAARLRERYLAIDAHLRAARLPFTVGFEFLPEGVRIRGLWYPVLKMEWVEGLQLNAFVREHLDRPDHLGAVLGVWARLSQRLREARLAHADLQHGNVLLVPGAAAQRLGLRLIDYDGMWVPALAGHPSGEAGHPNYQHPARLADQTYTPDVDRFPHLVIACALRALAVAGRPLWARFDNGDNLLFREADFADPARSDLLRTLWDLDDPTVTTLVALLAVASRRPIGDTPWLDEVLADGTAVPIRDAALGWAADLLGVPRRTRRTEPPTPAEPGQQPDPGETTRRPRAPRSRWPVVLAGAIGLLAVGVLTALLVSQRPPTPDPPTPADPPAAGVPGGRVRPLETRWLNFPSAPRALGVDALVTGIDVSPPGTKVVQSYPVGGAAALGAWLQADGRHAVLASATGFGVLDLATGTLQPVPLTGTAIVRVAVTPDGRHAVIADSNQQVRCVAPDDGAVRWSHDFPGPVTALEVTPDGERVAVSGEQVGYVEWGVADGSEVRRHERLRATRMSFSPDGSHAVAITPNGVEVWSLADGRATVVGPDVSAAAVCISADGETALAAESGSVHAWSVADGQALPDWPSPIRTGVRTLTGAGGGLLLFGGAGEVGYLGPDGIRSIFTLAPDSGPVVSIAITADRQHALVATERGAVALTRLADLVRPGGPSPVGPTVGCLEYVRSVPLAADADRFAADAQGKRVIAASATHCRVYSGDTLARGRPLQIPGGGIVAVGAGPADRLVACQAVGDGFETRTYDPGGGDAGPVFELPGPGDTNPGRVSRVVPVPGRPWVIGTTATAGDVLFDPDTGKVAPGWPDPRPGDPAVAAPSPDGKLIAFGTGFEPVRFWNADSHKLDRPLAASIGVARLAFTPDGARLIGLWPLGRIRVWDVVGGKFLREVEHDYPGPFNDLAVLSDRLVVLGTPTGRLVFDIDTRRALNTGNGPDPLAGRGVVVPARGTVLAATPDHRLIAWRVNGDRGRRLPPKPAARGPWPDVGLLRDAPASPPVGLAITPDGKSVLAATENGRILRYTVDGLLYRAEIVADEAPLYGFALAGDQLFTLGRRSMVRVRDANTLQKAADIQTDALGTAVPILLSPAPDGAMVLLASDRARLADVASRKEIPIGAVPAPAAGEPMTQFARSADGRVAVGRWGDAVTAVWDPRSGAAKVLEVLATKTPASPQGLAVTPDGKAALLGTGDGTLTAWDTATGEQLFRESVYPDAGPGEAITAVVTLPDGARFLTAGLDGRLFLWERSPFRRSATIRLPRGAWRFAVAPDGRAVVAQAAGAMARIELPAATSVAPR